MRRSITFAEWREIRFESIDKTTGAMRITVYNECPKCEELYEAVWQGVPPIDAYLMPDYNFVPRFSLPPSCACGRRITELMPAKSILRWRALSEAMLSDDIRQCREEDERRGQRKAEKKGRCRHTMQKKIKYIENFDENY